MAHALQFESFVQMTTTRFVLGLSFSMLALTAGCASPASEEQDESTAAMTSNDDQNPESADAVTEADLARGRANAAGMVEPSAADDDVLPHYAAIDPTNLIPKKLRDEAIRYYDANKSRFENQKWITVVNMTAHSKNKRFYQVNMETGAVEPHVVSHGLNSDPENDGTPSSFGNVPDSKKTSLGFYKTAETYNGSNGYSLRLDGLSATNSKARERAIVVHGADYVKNGSAKQGRSWGCPAVPMPEKDAVINKMKNGSLLYIGTL